MISRLGFAPLGFLICIIAIVHSSLNYRNTCSVKYMTDENQHGLIENEIWMLTYSSIWHLCWQASQFNTLQQLGDLYISFSKD